jgi:hypothetical protein
MGLSGASPYATNGPGGTALTAEEYWNLRGLVETECQRVRQHAVDHGIEPPECACQTMFDTIIDTIRESYDRTVLKTRREVSRFAAVAAIEEVISEVIEDIDEKIALAGVARVPDKGLQGIRFRLKAKLQEARNLSGASTKD